MSFLYLKSCLSDTIVESFGWGVLFWERDSKWKLQNWEHVFFREMLWNKILKVCFYFCSTERNSTLFSLPWNGSERNFESVHLFFSKIRAFFSSMEWFGKEFREFFVPQTICFVYSVFRGIIFCQKFPTLPSRSIKSVRISQYVFHIRDNTSLKNIDDICLPLYAHGSGLINF